MSVNNVFLVGNGSLQLINAVEASAYYLPQSEEDSFLLISESQERNKELLKLRDWGHIHWISPFSRIGETPQPFRLFKSRRYIRQVQSILKGYRGCERLFVGEYTEINRHIANWLRPQETIYITDGMEVALTSAARARALARFPARPFKEHARARLYGWDPAHLKQLTYFSAMPPTLLEPDRFEENKYSFISEQFATGLRARDVVAFVGSPHYALPPGRHSREYWQRFEVLVSNIDDKIEYWPHRKEPEPLAKSRCKELKVAFRQSPDPIEIAFLKEGCPKILLGFMSTSLYTCKSIFAHTGLRVAYAKADDYLERKWIDMRKALNRCDIWEHQFDFNPRDFGIVPIREADLPAERRWYYS